MYQSDLEKSSSTSLGVTQAHDALSTSKSSRIPFATIRANTTARIDKPSNLTLGKASAIGIAVSCVVAGVMTAVALMCCIFRRRRRRTSASSAGAARAVEARDLKVSHFLFICFSLKVPLGIMAAMKDRGSAPGSFMRRLLGLFSGSCGIKSRLWSS